MALCDYMIVIPKFEGASNSKLEKVNDAIWCHWECKCLTLSWFHKSFLEGKDKNIVKYFNHNSCILFASQYDKIYVLLDLKFNFV